MSTRRLFLLGIVSGGLLVFLVLLGLALTSRPIDTHPSRASTTPEAYEKSVQQAMRPLDAADPHLRSALRRARFAQAYNKAPSAPVTLEKPLVAALSEQSILNRGLADQLERMPTPPVLLASADHFSSALRETAALEAAIVQSGAKAIPAGELDRAVGPKLLSAAADFYLQIQDAKADRPICQPGRCAGGGE